MTMDMIFLDSGSHSFLSEVMSWTKLRFVVLRDLFENAVRADIELEKNPEVELPGWEPKFRNGVRKY